MDVIHPADLLVHEENRKLKKAVKTETQKAKSSQQRIIVLICVVAS